MSSKQVHISITCENIKIIHQIKPQIYIFNFEVCLCFLYVFLSYNFECILRSKHEFQKIILFANICHILEFFMLFLFYYIYIIFIEIYMNILIFNKKYFK